MCCPTGQRPSMRRGLSASGLWHAAGCQRPDRQDQPPSTTRGALAACSHVCPSMQEAACISWYGTGPKPTRTSEASTRLDRPSPSPLSVSSLFPPATVGFGGRPTLGMHQEPVMGPSLRRGSSLGIPERTKYLISTCRALLAVFSWCCLSRLRPHRPFCSSHPSAKPRRLVSQQFDPTDRARGGRGRTVLYSTRSPSRTINQPTGIRTTTQDEPGSTRRCPQVIGRARTWACHHLIFPNALRLRKPSSYTHARTSDRQ
jgi:hypothetical protein